MNPILLQITSKMSNSLAARLSDGPMEAVLSLLDPLSRGALFRAVARDRHMICDSFSHWTVLAADDRDVAVICGGVSGGLQPVCWDNLTALTLVARSMSESAIHALVKARLPSLVVLCLGQVPLQPCHAWHMANNFASRLRRLEMCRMKLSSKCLAKVTQDHRLSWPMLETLTLDTSTLDAPQVEQLLPVLFPQLRNLEFPCCKLMPRALLRTINLSGNNLAVCDFQRLSQANLLVLHQLYLGNTGMNERCVAHLVSGDWPLLQTLDLSGNEVDTQAMEHMETREVHLSWQEMTHFTLSNCKNHLTDDGIQPLLSLEWSQLQTLSLSNVGLKVTGFYLLSNGSWPALEVLQVTNNNLVHKLYRHYTAAPNRDMQLPLPTDSGYWRSYMLLLGRMFWPALRCLEL